MSDYGKFYVICDIEYRNYYYFVLMVNYIYKFKKYVVDYVKILGIMICNFIWERLK